MEDSIFVGWLGGQLLDRSGPDGMIYVLTDSNPPATAKMYKITPKN